MGTIDPQPRMYQLTQMGRDVVRDGLTRVGIRGDDALVTVNWFDPGFRTRGPHSHPFDQLSFVFSGTLEMTAGEETFILTAGSVLRIPADVPHSAQPIGEEVVLNVDVFAPVRDDFRYLTAYQDVDAGDGAASTTYSAPSEQDGQP